MSNYVDATVVDGRISTHNGSSARYNADVYRLTGAADTGLPVAVGSMELLDDTFGLGLS